MYICTLRYVINYTFPLTTEDYVHRIGRTGRAGKTGISHTFFTADDKALSGEFINVLREANQVSADIERKRERRGRNNGHQVVAAHCNNHSPPPHSKTNVTSSIRDLLLFSFQAEFGEYHFSPPQIPVPSLCVFDCVHIY